MIKLYARLSGRSETESGLSIIEVLVAMLIFAVLSVGVAYALLSTLQLTSDARGRQTAANLASTEIDSVREITDVINLGAKTTVTTVDGITYTIVRSWSWVNGTGGTSSACASGTGALLSKQVSVDVTWTGMRNPSNPVESGTIVSPTSRLNDIDKGVILATVITATGAGNPGVTVSAVPNSSNPNGATAITSTISPTDSQGCTVILNVVPGNYIVSIAKTGGPTRYVNEKEVAAPTVSVPVTAGTTSPAAFQFDQSTIVTPNFHSNVPNTGSLTVTMPLTMDTTYLATNFLYTSTTTPVYLHPYSAGYLTFAGAAGASLDATESCKSVDPSNWPASTDGSLVPPARFGFVPTAAGATASVNVPMGVFRMSGLAGKYVRAVSQTAGPAGTADPGCARTSTYIFLVPSGSSATLALPFGSWLLTSGTTSGTQGTAVLPAAVAMVSAGGITGTASTIITFDPRVAP